MKIAYVTAGAAGMYCGSCMHDNTLVTALRRLGHDAMLIPTYTPIRTDEPDASQPRVFFGGINVFLQQKLSLFRYTPRFFDRLLDAHTLPIQLARWHVAPLSAGIIPQMPRRLGPACAPVPNTRRHRLSSNQGGNTRNGRFTPLACSAAAQSSPLVVTATPPPSSRDSVSTTASSHRGPPRMLLELWPTTTADRRIGANCRQPRSRSSSGSTPLESSRQRAHGARAVTRAACTDTFGGTIAHHSASGTTSLPTMNMPIRACQPQLSLCVMTSLRCVR